MSKVVITSINPGDSDYAFEEFVVLENNSSEKIYLDNWKIVWQEWPSQRKLHEYIFSNWKSKKRSFDQQEKIFIWKSERVRADFCRFFLLLRSELPFSPASALLNRLCV